MITQTFADLPAVTDEQRASILSALRTAGAHRALLSALPAMNAVQLGGVAQSALLPAEFTVAAWNVERCLFPEATVDHLVLLQTY